MNCNKLPVHVIINIIFIQYSNTIRKFKKWFAVNKDSILYTEETGFTLSIFPLNLSHGDSVSNAPPWLYNVKK